MDQDHRLTTPTPAAGSASPSAANCAKQEPLVAPLEAVRYDVATGLVPVIVQDDATGEVLMQAYADREALKRTLDTGEAWFWSRSRRTYWHKGDTSGNVQRVREVRVDCDGDSVLYRVDPAGPACHTGARSCFYRVVRRDAATVAAASAQARPPAPAEEASAPVPAPAADSRADQAQEVISARSGAAPVGDVTPPDASPKPANDVAGMEVLERLWRVIDERWRDRPAGSYTTYLFTQGVDKAAKKVGEEAVEVALAAKNAAGGDAAGREELARESADLIYHLLALWRLAGIRPGDVWQVLAARER